MNIASKIKPFYKHLGVLTFFFVITYVTFSPLFKGLSLPQHDIKMWEGGAKECIDFRKANNGEETLWTNSMFGGMPAYLISTRYPGNMTKVFQIILGLDLPGIAKIMFTSLVCFYICLLCFKVRWPVAVFGSIAFTFTAFNLVSLGAGHNSKILTLALLPLMIGGFKLVLNRKYILGGALFAMGTTLEIGAGHPQITYYGGIIILFLFVAEVLDKMAKAGFGKDIQGPISKKVIVIAIKIIAFTFTNKDMRSTVGVLLLTGLIGLLPHTSRLLTLKEYSQYSTRGKSELTLDKKDAKDGLTRDYVFGYSQGLKECNNLFLPNMFIDGRGNKWSDVNSYPMYYGIGILILFLMMFTILKPKDWTWILITSIIGLIFALGKHFPTINYYFYDHLPLYSKFRAVNMALAMFQFSFVLGGTLVLNEIVSPDFKLTKWIKINLIAVGAIFIIGIILNLNMTASVGDIELSERALSIRQSGIWSAIIRSSIYLVLYGGIIFFAIVGKKNKALIFGSLASILLLIDLSSANSPHFDKKRFTKTRKTKIRANVANKDIMKRKGHDRVVDFTTNPFNDATASYFHHSLGGYHGAKLRRFQDLVDTYFSGQSINQIFEGLNKNALEEKNKNNGFYKILKCFNTKYIIHNPQQPPVVLNSLGNGWFIKNVKNVKSPDEEIAYLGETSFSPESIAVIDESKFKTSKTNFSNTGSILLTKYLPNKLTYSVKTDEDGLAVFSEVYYPEGWIATINGKETDIKRVNYLQRALEIPKGEHTVIFEFKPDSYYTGEKIAMIGSILVIILLFGAIGWEVSSLVKEKEEKELAA